MDTKTIANFCGFSEDSQEIADFATKVRVFEERVKEARRELLTDTLNHINSGKLGFSEVLEFSFGLIFNVQAGWYGNDFRDEYKKISEATRNRLRHIVEESNSASDMLGFYLSIDDTLAPRVLMDGIQSTIIDRLTTLANGCASLQELITLFDGCELRGGFGKDEISSIFLERATQFAELLEQTPYPDFITLAAFVSQLDDFAETDITSELRDILDSMISNETNYLELIIWHNHAGHEHRRKIEERLAELNSDTSSLSDDEFNHRCSITPLGCKARELLEQGS